MARNGKEEEEEEEEEEEQGEDNHHEHEHEHERELGRSSSAGSRSQSPPPPVSSSAPVLRPKRDPFLIVCTCFSVITALSAILCIVVNILSAIRIFKRIKGASDVFDGIFRCYAVVLALFVVIAETEWSLVFKLCKLLEYWPGRAMLQIFVAIMTRAFLDDYGQRKDLILLHDIASYILLGCGAVYLLSGILCIGYLKRVRERKQTTRDQAVKDLEELDQRRQELESLLIQNSV